MSELLTSELTCAGLGRFYNALIATKLSLMATVVPVSDDEEGKYVIY